jgi:hypothetical protein
MATLSVEQLELIGKRPNCQTLPNNVTLPSDIDKEFKLPKYTHKNKPKSNNDEWRTAGRKSSQQYQQNSAEAEPEWATTSVQDLDQPFDFSGRVLDRDAQQRKPQSSAFDSAIPLHRSRFDFAEEPEVAPFNAQQRGDSRFQFAAQGDASSAERSRFGFALENNGGDSSRFGFASAAAASPSESVGVKVSVDNLFKAAGSSELPPMPSGGSKKPSYIHGYMKSYGQ